MSEGWKAAQDQLRDRIWAARVAGEEEGPGPPLAGPLQPPELVSPAIESHRPLLGRPITLLKRSLHRLLVPLALGPQAEFNLRVAALLNEPGGAGHRDRAIQEAASHLAELRGDVLALRGELQAQRVLLERLGQAGALEPGDAADSPAA